tara:strand:- start:17 stop:637 length:621 start_codon:yes stop_codon:yes gene_type:complete
MNKRKDITIIDYDAGNIFNIVSTLKKLNVKLHVTKNPKNIVGAEKIIIPGVGAFKEGIKSLKKRKLFYPLKEFLSSEKPMLGICLGMQYFMDVSYEFKKTSGLNYFDGNVIKFDQNKVKRLPHIGWNYIKTTKNKIFKNIKSDSTFYFCHSYYTKPNNKKYIIGKTNYNKIEFCSVINKKNIYGCQFHPERSADAGFQFLKNFINL